MNEGLSTALRQLSRVPGVRGAIVADAEAGVPILQEVSEGVDALALAALAASAFLRTTRSIGAVGFGPVRTLQLEAEAGHLLVSGGGELLVIALLERGAQLGLARLGAQRVLEAVG